MMHVRNERTLIQPHFGMIIKSLQQPTMTNQVPLYTLQDDSLYKLNLINNNNNNNLILRS
jgi:hypothetical protein